MIYVRLILIMVYNLRIDSSHATIHSPYFHQPYAHDQPSRDEEVTPPSAESRLRPCSFSTAPSTPPQHLDMDRSRPICPQVSGMAEGSSDSAAISPMLRRLTTPNSERSPQKTSATQQFPPSSSSKSPNEQHSLLSLRAIQLEPFLDGRSPDEHAPRDTNRASFPLSNGTVNSPLVPPMSSIASRTAQYPSLQTRMNDHFHQPYAHGQPPPTHSDVSPRVRDFANMSPPERVHPHQYFPDSRTPQSEELTPQSAESHLSTSSFSDAPSPNPLSDGTLMVGTFKCEHAGCTAPPFQTQYLLK